MSNESVSHISVVQFFFTKTVCFLGPYCVCVCVCVCVFVCVYALCSLRLQFLSLSVRPGV